VIDTALSEELDNPRQPHSREQTDDDLAASHSAVLGRCQHAGQGVGERPHALEAMLGVDREPTEQHPIELLGDPDAPSHLGRRSQADDLGLV
jgi:hypothetical protein